MDIIITKSIKVQMIFSKELSKTDIEHRLSVPMENHGAFPLGEDFVATDEKTGYNWTFHCSVRKDGHPKPALVKEWVAFVRTNNLKIGDEVEFYKFKDQATGEIHYRVRARARGENQVKIFGCIIG